MPDWADVFLLSLSESPNVSEACRVAGIGRRTAYDARERLPEFAAAWDDALDSSVDNLVGECYRRARDGCKREVFYKGDPVGSYHEYSDTLAIFLLKAHRRNVYGDKSALEVSGANGGALKVEVYLPDNGRDPPQTEQQAPGAIPGEPG